MGNFQSLPNGAMSPNATWGKYNNIDFAIQQALAKMQTATLVQIKACTNDGGLSPVGFVDVLPLVNQTDSNGNPQPHVTIYGLPYLRLQGGANAVIIDPSPGDIGIAIFASRDLTKVISTKAQANPGSARRYDFSDGLYLGGMLNAVPTQYIQFAAGGVTIKSPTLIKLIAPSIELDGSIALNGSISATIPGAGTATISGSIAATGDVTASGTSLHTHVHTSEAAGTPTSPPL